MREIVLSLFCICLYAQSGSGDKWQKYFSDENQYSIDPKLWLEAEQSLGSMPADDWRRVYILNQLVSACDEADWEDGCGGQNRRNDVLNRAVEASAKVQPRDLRFSEQLVEVANHLEIPGDLKRAIALLEESQAIAAQVKGPKSLEVSRRLISMSSLYRRANRPEKQWEMVSARSTYRSRIAGQRSKTASTFILKCWGRSLRTRIWTSGKL